MRTVIRVLQSPDPNDDADFAFGAAAAQEAGPGQWALWFPCPSSSRSLESLAPCLVLTFLLSFEMCLCPNKVY